MKKLDETTLSIYVHWPFCESKCPYCDFNSHVRKSIDDSAWEIAYIKSIENWFLDKPRNKIKSIYFGGGTPSLMKPSTIEKIIQKLYSVCEISNNPEITMEANPSSIEMEKFSYYASAGINRVSIGVQALNNYDLKKLGRKHTVQDAINSIKIAKKCFNNISFDLIYARQDQTLKSWSKELKSALSLADNHISLYQLTIEKHTRFEELNRRGLLRGLPCDDLAADFYDLTQDICNKKNLPAYEISNHAKLGSESVHNLNYWRYQNYLGIGPGAHSRMVKKGQKFSIENFSVPEKWLSEIISNRSGVSSMEPVTIFDQAEEYLMMALRLEEGANLDRYETLAKKSINTEKIDQLKDLNLINIKENILQISPNGKKVLNTIISHLIV